jgi:multidrug efflux pump subunit AcrB
LARRLHATLGGGGTGGGEDQEEASLAEFEERLGDAYNLRWRLLSSVLDHACRWVFVLAYLCSVLTTAIVLTSKQGALFPEHVQTTTA